MRSYFLNNFSNRSIHLEHSSIRGSHGRLQKKIVSEGVNYDYKNVKHYNFLAKKNDFGGQKTGNAPKSFYIA